MSRLRSVIGYVCALADLASNDDVMEKVAELNDYKGHLTVWWNKQPTEQEMGFFVRAWESDVGDGADNVSHERCDGCHPRPDDTPSRGGLTMNVWKITGESANDSGGGDTIVYAITGSDMEMPDVHAALKASNPWGHAWYNVISVENLGPLPAAYDSTTAEGMAFVRLLAAVPGTRAEREARAKAIDQMLK